MKVIETGRLILRLWQEKDVEPYYIIQACSENMQYMSRSLSRQEVKDFIPSLNDHFERHGYTLWAVEYKQDSALIGYIGFSYADFDAPFTPAIDLGFMIDRAYQKRGLATEGALACLEYGWKNLGFKEVVAYTAKENSGALRVLEKLGMKRDCDGDFLHPNLHSTHALAHQVLYRI